MGGLLTFECLIVRLISRYRVPGPEM